MGVTGALKFWHRIKEIDEAWGYCVEHDKWPEGFHPGNAIRDLLLGVHAYRRSLTAHHNIAHLSEKATREGLRAGACQVCKEAQASVSTVT